MQIRSPQLIVLVLGCVATSAPAQSTAQLPEVRQIVSFRFLPGRMAAALQIYQEQLKPIYSPVSALALANEALRRPSPSGQSALSLYGTLSEMTAAHHDQFVEIIAPLSDSAAPGGLTVFEYLRLAPGAEAGFEPLLARQVRRFERNRKLVHWSETGRMLVSDSWDYLRIFNIRSLGDWHHYLMELRSAPFHAELQRRIAARKTIIVRDLPSLAVR